MNLKELGFENFQQGLELEYNKVHGYLKFIDEAYITICVHPTTERTQFGDVCVVVYPSLWNKVNIVEVKK
jgi:hypothetical protein